MANVETKSRVGAKLCGWVLSCIQGHAALGSPTAPSKRRMPAPAPEPAPAPVPSAEATAAAAVEAQIGTTLQRMVSEPPLLSCCQAT